MSHFQAKMHQIRFQVCVFLSLCPCIRLFVCRFVSQIEFNTLTLTKWPFEVCNWRFVLRWRATAGCGRRYLAAACALNISRYITGCNYSE